MLLEGPASSSLIGVLAALFLTLGLLSLLRSGEERPRSLGSVIILGIFAAILLVSILEYGIQPPPPGSRPPQPPEPQFAVEQADPDTWRLVATLDLSSSKEPEDTTAALRALFRVVITRLPGILADLRDQLPRGVRPEVVRVQIKLRDGSAVWAEATYADLTAWHQGKIGDERFQRLWRWGP